LIPEITIDLTYSPNLKAILVGTIYYYNGLNTSLIMTHVDKENYEK